MAYEFKGFFTENETAALAALNKWPFCKMKAVTSQMDGYVIRIPVGDDLDRRASDQDYEVLLEQASTVEEGLLAFSAQFPQEILVYLHVECFGGLCDEAARHLQGGQLLREIANSAEEPSRLQEMLAPVGARIGATGVFDPLKRNFFSD